MEKQLDPQEEDRIRAAKARVQDRYKSGELNREQRDTVFAAANKLLYGEDAAGLSEE